jgi:hypothetical protein
MTSSTKTEEPHEIACDAPQVDRIYYSAETAMLKDRTAVGNGSPSPRRNNADMPIIPNATNTGSNCETGTKVKCE